MWLDNDGGLWLRQGDKGLGRPVKIGHIVRSPRWPRERGDRPDWFAAEIKQLKTDWADPERFAPEPDPAVDSRGRPYK
jgi:hypothetical protein